MRATFLYFIKEQLMNGNVFHIHRINLRSLLHFINSLSVIVGMEAIILSLEKETDLSAVKSTYNMKSCRLLHCLIQSGLVL